MLGWVAWFNKHRHFGPVGYVPPAEFEAAYHQQIKVPELKEFTL